LPVDLKTLTPDTTVPSTAVLFGADSQAATDPSVYPLSAVRAGVNLGDVILTDAPFISWNVETSRIASVTLGGNRTLLSPTNHKDGGEYKLLVFQDATGGRTLAYDNNIIWPGGTAPNLSGAAANSLIVITFISDGVRLYASADQTYDGTTPTLYHNFASSVLPSWLTFARTGHATMVDSSGNITWAPNNMLLNSATLSTQSVSTAGGLTNILSFRGTGSVTLSGSATGTLAGTGLNNRVSLVVNPSAGSLTLTVSGQVLDAQLERVTYETSPRAYNPTTGVAFFGPRFDWTTGVPGILVEGSRSNLLIQSQGHGITGSWPSTIAGTGLNPVRSTSPVSAPDGTLTATRISVSLDGGTTSADISGISQTWANSSPLTVTASLWLRADTPCQIALRNPVNSGAHTTLSVTTTWQRFTVTEVITGNVSFFLGLRGGAVTADCTVDVWGTQLEVGAHASSYIPTTTAGVARASDIAVISGSEFSNSWNPSEGSIIIQVRPQQIGNLGVFSASSTVSSSQNRMDYRSNGGLLITAGGIEMSGLSPGGMTSNTVHRLAFAYRLNDCAAVMNGGFISTDTSATIPTVDRLHLGSLEGNGALVMNGHIQSFAYYRSRISNTTLQAKSVAGANY
jgi:hypothetical protein